MQHNSILLRFPGGLEKAVTLSYDDGVEEDIRLIEIMEKYGLRGTFNINSGLYCPEGIVSDRPYGKKIKAKIAAELYSHPGIEPALHGYTHAITNTLPEGPMAYEILKDRETLEEQFSSIIRGMAYPNNAYSDTVIRGLKACGIVYARTTDATRTFAIPTDWHHWDPTCQHTDPLLPKLTETFLNTFPTKHQDGFLFYLWGHTYEFARDDNWQIAEKFAASVGNRPDVWYGTNLEIYEYVECFRHLIFDLKQTRVYNPTATGVWFMLREKLRFAKPGTTVVLD